MVTIVHTFAPEMAQYPDTNPATLRISNFNGGGEDIPSLEFAGASTDKFIHFRFRALSYASGNLQVDIDWAGMDGTTSGNVVWGAQIAAITPNSDTEAPSAPTFATASTVQDAHIGTVGSRLHRCSITINNLDGLAADDYVILQIYRDASDTSNDTYNANAHIVMVTLSYTGT